MLKDQYWDEVFPVELPYTAAAKQYQTGPPQHSAEEVEVPSHKAEFMPLDSVVEEKVEESETDSGNDVDVCKKMVRFFFFFYFFQNQYRINYKFIL